MHSTKPPLERAARALCSLDGHPENATMEGKPLWQDYLPEARAVIEAIREIDDPQSPVLAAGKCTTGHWRGMIDQLLAEGG